MARKIKELREAFQAYSTAKRDDGEIDELEAPKVAKEMNDVIAAVFGQVKGKSARALFRSLLEDGLRRLDQEGA